MSRGGTRLPGRRLAFAGIAASAATVEERAAEVLHQLGRALPFDAGWLAVRDPEQHRHVPLATMGTAAPLRGYFGRPEADEEVDQLGLNRRRPPMLASEIPSPLSEVRAWAEHLLPAGFREGVAAGLFTADGRHIGFLSLLSADPARPDQADRDVVAAVTGVFAEALDRTRDMAETARVIGKAGAGVVLTRGGDVLPLPGLPDDPLLVPDSPVLTVAAEELARSGAHATFLAAAPGTDGEQLIRVTALDFARPDLDHLSAAVLLSPPGTCTTSPLWISGSWASWSRASPPSRPSRSHSAWPRRRWPTPCDEAWSPCGPATSRRPQCAPCAAGRVFPPGVTGPS